MTNACASSHAKYRLPIIISWLDSLEVDPFNLEYRCMAVLTTLGGGDRALSRIEPFNTI